jgi:hypothetical protein
VRDAVQEVALETFEVAELTVGRLEREVAVLQFFRERPGALKSPPRAGLRSGNTHTRHATGTGPGRGAHPSAGLPEKRCCRTFRRFSSGLGGDGRRGVPLSLPAVPPVDSSASGFFGNTVSKRMKQAEDIENTYFTVLEKLKEPHYARIVFGIPAILLLLFAIATLRY